MHKGPVKAAFIVGISTFIGFSLIFPATIVIDGIGNWQDIGTLLGIIAITFGYFLFAGTATIGLIEAMIFGLIGYLVFKFMLPSNINKKQLNTILISSSIICIMLGLLSFSYVDRFIREVHGGKENVSAIDNNEDGKPDKWVHYNIYDTLTEVDYDTNFDGNPDIFEYYRNSKVYRKEIDTDFDGKPDKVEDYR